MDLVAFIWFVPFAVLSLSAAASYAHPDADEHWPPACVFLFALWPLVPVAGSVCWLGMKFCEFMMWLNDEEPPASPPGGLT